MELTINCPNDWQKFDMQRWKELILIILRRLEIRQSKRLATYIESLSFILHSLVLRSYKTHQLWPIQQISKSVFMTPEILRRISISLYLPLVRQKKRIFPVKPASSLDKVLNVGELHLLGEIAPARFVMALGGRKLRADAWRRSFDNIFSDSKHNFACMMIYLTCDQN